MGYPLYREVKKWAPATLTHREKLAAMVLADDANDVTRETFNSVVDPDILRFAMVRNDRDMRKILARLVEEKVLERVTIGGNGRTAKYRFLHLASADSADVAGPEETPNGTTSPDLAGPKETSNSGVAGTDQTSNTEGQVSPDVPEKTSNSGVAGSFRNSCRSNLDLPTPLTSSTTSSTTPASDESDAAGDSEGTLFEEPVPDARSVKPKRATKRTEQKPNRHQVADDLTAAFWKHHGAGRAQPFIAVRGIVRTAIGNGVDRDDCAHALKRIADEGRTVSGATLDIALGQIRRGGQRTTAPPTAPRHMTEEEKLNALQF